MNVHGMERPRLCYHWYTLPSMHAARIVHALRSNLVFQPDRLHSPHICSLCGLVLHLLLQQRALLIQLLHPELHESGAIHAHTAWGTTEVHICVAPRCVGPEVHHRHG